MERIGSELDRARQNLREFAQLIAGSCQQHGVYQEPTSVSVHFAANGDITAQVTTRARLFIRHDQ